MFAQVDDRPRPIADEGQLVEDEQPVTRCVGPEAQHELDRLAELVGGLDGLEREEAGSAGMTGGDPLGDEALDQGRLAALTQTPEGEHGARGEVIGVERAGIPAERRGLGGGEVQVVGRPPARIAPPGVQRVDLVARQHGAEFTRWQGFWRPQLAGLGGSEPATGTFRCRRCKMGPARTACARQS